MRAILVLFTFSYILQRLWSNGACFSYTCKTRPVSSLQGKKKSCDFLWYEFNSLLRILLTLFLIFLLSVFRISLILFNNSFSSSYASLRVSKASLTFLRSSEKLSLSSMLFLVSKSGLSCLGIQREGSSLWEVTDSVRLAEKYVDLSHWLAAFSYSLVVNGCWFSVV
jgi:hypothetical protein